MNQLFNMDNKFFRSVSKITDYVWLSLLWMLCCVPVVTIGAATTALYYTVNKTIRHDRGYVASEFFKAFKDNFKQSTIVWVVFLVIYILLGMDYYIMRTYAGAGAEIGKFAIVFPVLAVLLTMWGFYVFPYIARFENTTKNMLKNSALIANGNAPWTLLILVLFAATWIACALVLPLVLVMPVLYTNIKNLIVEKVFKKYMTPEDLALEEERNREFYN